MILPALTLLTFLILVQCSQQQYHKITINRTAIDDLVMKEMKSPYISAVSVAILQMEENDSKVADEYGNGYGDLQPWNPSTLKANADTRFCIASVTKQFTAALVGHMLEKNNFKLYATEVAKELVT